MTKAQAAALQLKWNEQKYPPECAHRNQELEESQGPYLTGKYYCTDCGEAVSRKLEP